MNLYDMLRRNDPNVVVSGGVAGAKEDVMGERWRGIRLSAPSRLEVVDARRFYSLRSQPDTCGWYVRVPENAVFEIGFVDSATKRGLSTWRQATTSTPVPVRIPWPKMPGSRFDLGISVSGTAREAIFLAVHRALSRDWLYREATGVGLELGPGPVPQILATEGVDVSYVEQMPPDDWDRLYNQNGRFPRRPDLWSKYVIGDAGRLPAADGSLDFIFSSHVFEHLANPIGHLEHWFRKLRTGGRVLCVIPDLMGTKDALQKPSSMDEWLGEYREACWTPTPAHYGRYFRQSPQSETVAKALQDRFSIHAHFYTNTNCQELLTFACESLGFTSFDIEWTPNSKDFHFVVRKG